MNIAAADLKRLLKKLNPVKTDTYRFDVDGIIAQDSDVIVAVQGPSFGGTFNINGKNLSRTVGRASGQINIEQTGNKLILTWAKAKVELEIQPVKSVPLPELNATAISFSAAELKKALNLTLPSANPAKSAAGGGVVQLQSLPLRLEAEEIPGYRVVGTDLIVMTIAQVLKPVPFEFNLGFGPGQDQLVPRLLDVDLPRSSSNRAGQILPVDVERTPERGPLNGDDHV